VLNLNNSLIYKSKNAYDYALAVLAFFIPIIPKGLPLVILGTAILGMLYYVIAYRKVGRKKKDYVFLPYNLLKDGFSNILKNRNTHLVMVCFFFYYLLSVLYSEDKEEAWKGVLLKSSFLYFPILFSLTKWDVGKTRRIFNSYILGCFTNLILSYVFVFIDNESALTFGDFNHSSLSFSFHPSYIAMYVNVAIIFNSILLFESSINESKIIVKLRWLLQILFSVFVIMLSSKSGLLTWFLSTGALLAYLIIEKGQVLKTIIVFLTLSLLFLFTFKNLSIIGVRMDRMVNTLVKAEYKNTEGRYNSTGSRVGIWSNSFDVVKSHPILGVGIGDGKHALMNKYKEVGMDQFYELKHNSHNQFLDTGLAIGGLGILVLLLMLFFGFINYGSVSILIIGLMGIVVGNLLVESMLERQGGVVFVTWLLALLVSVRPVLKTLK